LDQRPASAGLFPFRRAKCRGCIPALKFKVLNVYFGRRVASTREGGFGMAHVVVLGAGLGGAIMAYEMKDQMRPEDK
jgi:hypothetical protein